MLHGHGDDIYNQKAAILANFSSNVPKLQQNSDLINFWTQNLHFLHSYPEANAESFVEILAEKYRLKTQQLIATHGATEAIYLVAQAFHHKSSSILQPTFAEYADACSIFEHKILHSDKNDLKNLQSDLVWLCNPNNPTGQVYDYAKLLHIIDKNVNSIFVIDQTYRYFTKKQTLSYQDAVCRDNVILIDSFTKRYAVPGLRLGYMVANEKIINKITKLKPPWSVNQLAIETGKFLLGNDEILPLNLDKILENTMYLQSELCKIPNVNVYPSDTHFFLCKFNNIKAKQLKQKLIENHGILIRNANNFHGLDEYFIRIATQNKTDNLLLRDAILKEV